MDFNPQNIVSWLRSYANDLNRAADSLEHTFQGLASLANPQVPEPPQTKNKSLVGGVTISQENLAEAVSKKSGRVDDLARRLETNPKIIQALISSPKSLVTIGERGWLRVKPELKVEKE